MVCHQRNQQSRLLQSRLLNCSAFFSNNHFCLLFTDVVQLFFDLFISYCSILFSASKPFIVAKFNFRAFSYSSFENQVFTFFELFTFDFWARLQERYHFHEVQHCSLASQYFECFFHDSVFAEVHFQNTARRMTFTEARNVYLTCKCVLQLV